MREIIKNSGFIKDIKDIDQYVYGASSLPKVVLQADRDWRSFLPAFEPQLKRGIETYNCTSFNTLTPIEILMRRLFGDIGSSRNYSDRALGIFAGTKPPGNSPHKVAETIRKCGLNTEVSLPFSNDIQTVEEYYSFKGANEKDCIAEGKGWLTQFEFGHEWVFEGFMPLSEKQRRMWECLQYSPLAGSVDAWVEENGLYIHPPYVAENHWTDIVAAEWGVCWWAFDTYEPELKKLAWDYDFGQVKRYHLSEKTVVSEPKISWWERLQNFFVSIFKRTPSPLPYPLHPLPHRVNF